MKLQQLLSFLDLSAHDVRYSSETIFETEVPSLCSDARLVKQGSVFVAIHGTSFDGHQFISEAIQAQASTLVVENPQFVPAHFQGLVLVVPNTRQMLDLLAASFYDYPSQKLFCLGVTGTNGKTSITYFLEHILNSSKKLTGVIGTVNHRVGDKVWDSQMTTPDCVTLQSRLNDFHCEGALACALEVSSHALDQKRADSVHFNTVIFTNLTHDHLDYHLSMKDYFAAKQRLFTDLMWSSLKRPLFAIINTDDSYGKKLKVAEPVVAWTYGQNSEADFKFKILKMNFEKTVFELKTPLEVLEIELPLTGVHTIYNAVASMAAALTVGVSLEQSVKVLKTFTGVPGRLQKIEAASNKVVFVDYAHTPDALENSIQSLLKIKKEAQLNAQIITVFGCGGDRDKAKRPKMGEIATRLSDLVYVTSDNPRTENPQQILEDIKAGIHGSKLETTEFIVDREAAIQKALEKAQPGDVVLIAGKGHEDYQILGTEKIHFSDAEVASKYLK